MKDKTTKIIIILELITVICGFTALVLQLHGGVDYENPILWLLTFIVISSSASLITKIKDSKKKTEKKKK